MGNTRALILLFAAVGLCHCRSVTVSRGPLLRVEGQPLSIRCDVSDYEGPKEQDFEWTVMRGTESIKVISTFDQTFSDRSLLDRIKSGDISVSRLADNTVELRIQEARISDSATYHCSTPSTDSVIRGNYNADVQLNVVPNSLIVAPDVPNPVVPEGGSIRLLCNVTRNFMEGIYLSLTWSVKKGSSLLEDLLTFGPDLAVAVGKESTRRYTDGGMRLQMGNGVSHSLVLSGAMPEDQGMYVCSARLWTREEGVWKQIQEKTVEMGEVTVTPTVSTEECGKDLLVGTSCFIKLKTKNNEKPSEIRWVHDSRTGNILRWKDGNIKAIDDGVSMEEDGSLRFKSLRLTDTGKYTFNAENNVGQEIGNGEVEIKVYEKAPKPTVKISCIGGNVNLTCDIGNREDLTLSWFKDNTDIKNDKPRVFLSSTEVQENKPYSCEARNPVSKAKSESIKVSCRGLGKSEDFCLKHQHK